MSNRNQNFPIFRCNPKLPSEQKCKTCQQHDLNCNFQECLCEEWPELKKQRYKDSRKMKLIKFYEAKIIVDCDQNHISNFLFSQSHSRNCQTPKCALVLADRNFVAKPSNEEDLCRELPDDVSKATFEQNVLNQLTSLDKKIDIVSNQLCTVVNLFEGSEWKTKQDRVDKQEKSRETGRVRLKSENQFEAILELFKILVDISTRKDKTD